MLKNESFLFDRFLNRSSYSVAGFSLGAIEALEFVLSSKNRVDLIQLFSPAFFQDKDESFKNGQINAFLKNERLYKEIFFKNIAYPFTLDLSDHYKKESVDRLRYLLNYHYLPSMFDNLKSRGVKIEVYLGSLDKIIDPIKAKSFFQQFATIIEIKRGGHILWID